MAATVHPGRLQRWFEQLCRIRHHKLRELTDDGTRLRSGALPAEAAVYAFWWVGLIDPLRSPECSRELVVPGPGGREILIHFDDEWLGFEAGAPIPLYVGKTAAGLHDRVKQHLLLARERCLPPGGSSRKATRPTTSCQVRAGIDQMFPKNPDTRNLVLDNLALSWVALPGDDHAANRFYLEDLAVGLMRPHLNVDVER